MGLSRQVGYVCIVIVWGEVVGFGVDISRNLILLGIVVNIYFVFYVYGVQVVECKFVVLQEGLFIDCVFLEAGRDRFCILNNV